MQPGKGYPNPKFIRDNELEGFVLSRNDHIIKRLRQCEVLPHKFVRD